MNKPLIELLEVLKPFAKSSEGFTFRCGDHEDLIDYGSSKNPFGITVGDLRKAAELYERLKDGQK